MTTTGTAQAREADLLLGRKAVWEFDPHTRGWKLCVDADVNITDIQIGAVEIKDHATADRAHVDSSNLLHVFDHASTGAFILVWVTYDYPEDSAHSSGDYLAFVGGVRQHNIASPVGAEGDYQGFIFNNLGQLHTFTTGSHTIADTELPDATVITGSLGLTPTAPYAGALGYAFDISAQNKGWVPLLSDGYGEALANPSHMLVTKAFMQAAQHGGSVNYNVQIMRPTIDQETWSAYGNIMTVAGLYAYQNTSGTFARLRASEPLDGKASPPFALEVQDFNMGYDPIAGTWQRLRVDGAKRLEVTALVTGSVAIDSLPLLGTMDDNMSNPNLPGVASFNVIYDGYQWQRWWGIDTSQISISSGGFFPGVGSMGIYYNDEFNQWRRIEGADMSDATIDPASYIGNGNPFYGAILYAWDAAEGKTGAWRQAVMDTTGNLGVYLGVNLDETTDEVTAYVTGTVDTELPAAAALSDTFANPTAPAVGAFAMGFYPASGTWSRLTVDENDFLEVTLGTRLDETTDEVTAYVTGTMLIDGQTRTIQRQIINITGSAGEYMLVTGVAAQSIKVTEVMAISSADTELIFESGWTGTWLTGKLSLPSDGDGFFCNAVATPDQHHFETESGDILVLRLVAGAQIGGWINYYIEA